MFLSSFSPSCSADAHLMSLLGADEKHMSEQSHLILKICNFVILPQGVSAAARVWSGWSLCHHL